MKSVAAILCLALAAALAAACAPVPYRVALAPKFQTCEAQGIGAGSADGNTFVQKKVFFLSPSFDPQAPDPSNPQYKAPSGPSAYNYQPYSNDLAAAYNAAPFFFKEQLCGLDGVFIVQNACTTNPCTSLDITNNSWGFREHPPQIAPSTTPARYIAISQQLWQEGQAPIFSYYETRRLQQLLNWTTANPPSFTANPDIPVMSVLAAVAHEFGHVYWWDAYVPSPGGDAVPNNFCNGTFYSKSWRYPVTVPPGRWLTFGEVPDNNEHLPDDVDFRQLRNELSHRDFANAGDLLNGIYSGQWPGHPSLNEKNVQNGRWASALAAFSTDEDFVETFELSVLMNATPSLTDLVIRIYGTSRTPYTDDVPADLYGKPKPEVLRKLSCFGPLPS